MSSFFVTHAKSDHQSVTKPGTSRHVSIYYPPCEYGDNDSGEIVDSIMTLVVDEISTVDLKSNDDEERASRKRSCRVILRLRGYFYSHNYNSFIFIFISLSIVVDLVLLLFCCPLSCFSWCC